MVQTRLPLPSLLLSGFPFPPSATMTFLPKVAHKQTISKRITKWTCYLSSEIALSTVLWVKAAKPGASRSTRHGSLFYPQTPVISCLASLIGQRPFRLRSSQEWLMLATFLTSISRRPAGSPAGLLDWTQEKAKQKHRHMTADPLTLSQSLGVAQLKRQREKEISCRPAVSSTRSCCNSSDWPGYQPEILVISSSSSSGTSKPIDFSVKSKNGIRFLNPVSDRAFDLRLTVLLQLRVSMPFCDHAICVLGDAASATAAA